MQYATAYDIGKRKRKKDGINEDSIKVAVFEDGHREGYNPDGVETSDDSNGQAGVQSYGPGDSPPEEILDRDAKITEVYTSNDEEVGVGPPNRKAGVFVLADGAGGEESGDIASYIATIKITEELSKTLNRALMTRTGDFDLEFDGSSLPSAIEKPDEQTLQEAVADAIASANESIVEYANAENIGGMYTTVVAGIYIDDQFHYGWVGDSRIYVINKSHKDIAKLTKDHAKVTRLEEEDEIDEIEAYVHPDGNEIERALGGGAKHDPGQMRERTYGMVDTGSVQLYNDDIVLLTSDGLIDAQTNARELYKKYKMADDDEQDDVADKILEKVVTDELIREVSLDADSLQQAADEYIGLSNNKGGKDNISVILFSDEMLPNSPPAEISGLPERSIDPNVGLEERKTIIRKTD